MNECDATAVRIAIPCTSMHLHAKYLPSVMSVGGCQVVVLIAFDTKTLVTHLRFGTVVQCPLIVWSHFHGIHSSNSYSVLPSFPSAAAVAGATATAAALWHGHCVRMVNCSPSPVSAVAVAEHVGRNLLSALDSSVQFACTSIFIITYQIDLPILVHLDCFHLSIVLCGGWSFWWQPCVLLAAFRTNVDAPQNINAPL